MNATKKYITEITAKDLADLAAMTKLRVGMGLKLSKDSNGWSLELDTEGMKVVMSQIGVAWGELPGGL